MIKKVLSSATLIAATLGGADGAVTVGDPGLACAPARSGVSMAVYEAVQKMDGPLCCVAREQLGGPVHLAAAADRPALPIPAGTQPERGGFCCIASEHYID